MGCSDRDMPVWWLDRRVEPVLAGTRTGGLAAFTRGTVPPPGSPAPYVRLREEVLYLVTQGCVRTATAIERFELAAGDFCRVPPGVCHRLEDCGREPALVYAVYVPAGFDEFQRESGRPMRDPDAPVLPLTPVQIGQARRLARAHGVELPDDPDEAEMTLRVARAGDSPRYPLTQGEARFLAESETSPAYTLLELRLPAGDGPAMPPSTLAACCVLEGRVRMKWDGSEVYLTAGGAACAAGVPYSIGSAAAQPARLLLLTVSGAA